MKQWLSVIVIAAMAVGLFALPTEQRLQAQSPPVSLLPNSGLETLNPNNPAMPLGFSANGQQGVQVQVASVTDEVYAGERAALVSARTVAWTGIQTQIQQVVAAHGAEVYSISAYMRLASTGAANARINLKIVGHDNGILREDNLTNSTVITEAWTQVQANVDFTGLDLDDVKNIQISFNTHSLDSFYIDELSLLKQPEEPGEEEPDIGDAVYYVSSASGDDGAGDGSEQNPWRTIQKAADEAVAGDTVIIREGTYRETVKPAVRGVEAHPITFRAYPGEQVTVSGADEVTGWVQDEGHIYRASVAMELGHENQVFYNGEMLFEARWPNAGGYTPDKLLEFDKATMDEGTTATTIVDAQLPDYDWTGGSVWVNSDHRWLSWTGLITGSGTGSLEIVNNADAAGNHLAKAGGSYYVYGIKDALDTAGEWYYDGASLYAWVPGGGNPNGLIEVKKRLYAFDLAGKDHIHLENLHIHAATIKYDQQSDYNVLDGVTMRYLYHSNRADQAYLSQLDTGLMVFGTHNEILNSEIGYGSGSGVVLKGDDHRVVNSHIHDFNYIGSYAAPLIFNGKRNLVSHNTIQRAGRSVVGRGNDNGGFYDSLLQYNDLGYGGYLTADLGLLYFNAQDGGNSEIRYNWLHDNYAPVNQHGLHFDHGVKNMIVHHNAVWGVNGNAFRNNMHTNYVLWLNNTGTTAGSNGFGSTWAAAMEMDQHGSQWINNVTTGGILIQGSNATIYNNETNYGDLIDNKYLTSGTAPVDSAVMLQGITDAYSGQGPDRGAYELGQTPWTAGHNFLSPPVQVDVSRTAVRERNRVINASFEAAELAPWQTSGNQVDLHNFSSFQWDVNKTTLVGHYSARLGSGVNEIYQVIEDLEPDTTYEWMAKLRVDAGEQACIGVRDYGGAEVCSDPVASTNALWQKTLLTFRTGEQATSATVYVKKLSAGSGRVYVEDTGLQYKDPLNDVLIQAEELARLNPQLPAAVLAQLQQATEAAREVIEDATASWQEKSDAAASLQALNEVTAARVELLKTMETADSKHAAAVEGGAVGQYEPGAKAQLWSAIEEAEELLQDLQATMQELELAHQELEAELDTFLQRVNKTPLTALARADMISILQDLPQWSSQTNVQPQTDGSLAFHAVNKYLGETFRDELFEFDLRYTFNGMSRDWPGIVLRSQKESSSLIWQSADTAYLIVLKPNQWELQRFVDGAGGIIRTTPNTHFAGGQQTYRVQAGTEDMADGVRIFLYVDGVRVFDYIDTEAPLMLDGYFGYHNGPDTGAITVIAVED
ncbi:carbohydrate binding domain-containing protein [Paenibacillus sp. 1P07SE]|uniref:carbohydrate binding domain-containing protein n=1 Tax=Paenibacillus sp. 1P07SE TaxID=3132209 RepID=UPI0039A77ED3